MRTHVPESATATLLKERFWCRCFSLIFVKIFKNSFLTENILSIDFNNQTLKSLTTNAARFLKCVGPFWNVIH